MPVTPANMLEGMIAEAVQQPAQIVPPPPRQYMTPGMGNYEMGMDGLPIPKGQPQPMPINQTLLPPATIAQQTTQPIIQPTRRPDNTRRTI